MESPTGYSYSSSHNGGESPSYSAPSPVRSAPRVSRSSESPESSESPTHVAGSFGSTESPESSENRVAPRFSPSSSLTNVSSTPRGDRLSLAMEPQKGLEEYWRPIFKDSLVLERLHSNQRIIVEELICRGAEVMLIDSATELLQVSYKGRIDYVVDRFSSEVPFSMASVTANKGIVKSILKNRGIAVPDGRLFRAGATAAAMAYVAQTKGPMVVKPATGSHGDGVLANLVSIAEIREAVQRSAHTDFIVEQYFPWDEYRVFATRQGGFAVVNRVPAYVEGAGNISIKDLVTNETNRRVRQKSRIISPLCPIVIDADVITYLEKSGVRSGLGYVPHKGEKVQLRLQSNLAKGGVPIDVTDTVHATLSQLATQVMDAFPGLPVVGFDVLSKDITRPLGEDNYAVLEVNSSPGLVMHMAPSKGVPRNVAKMLVDAMFPWIR